MSGPYSTTDLTGNFIVDFRPGNDPNQRTTTFLITNPPTQNNWSRVSPQIRPSPTTPVSQ